MTMDEERMKYIWDDYAEMYFQHLKKIDELEWRKYENIHGRMYLAYIDDCPTQYSGHTPGKNTSDLVLNDLLHALKERSKSFRVLTPDEYQRWFSAKKAYKNWKDFDKDECSCIPGEQECPGCRGY